MRDYNRELRNRFNNCKDIDSLIFKMQSNGLYKVKEIELGNNFYTEEISKFYNLNEVKTYSIIQYGMQDNIKYKKAEITILYRNYNNEELQEIKNLKERELEEMGATSVEIFKNEIIRIFY